MNKRLFIGNLAFSVHEDDLRDAFKEAGCAPLSLRIITDQASGRSRGFAFAEFGSVEEAERAKAELHGQPIQGRTLRVDDAEERARPARPQRDRHEHHGRREPRW